MVVFVNDEENEGLTAKVGLTKSADSGIGAASNAGLTQPGHWQSYMNLGAEYRTAWSSAWWLAQAARWTSCASSTARRREVPSGSAMLALSICCPQATTPRRVEAPRRGLRQWMCVRTEIVGIQQPYR